MPGSRRPCTEGKFRPAQHGRHIPLPHCLACMGFRPQQPRGGGGAGNGAVPRPARGRTLGHAHRQSRHPGRTAGCFPLFHRRCAPGRLHSHLQDRRQAPGNPAALRGDERVPCLVRRHHHPPVRLRHPDHRHQPPLCRAPPCAGDVHTRHLAADEPLHLSPHPERPGAGVDRHQDRCGLCHGNFRRPGHPLPETLRLRNQKGLHRRRHCQGRLP